MDKTKVFGEFLMRKRYALNKTRAQIAKEVGVSTCTIHSVEQGDRLTSEGKLALYCGPYQATLVELKSLLAEARKARKAEISSRRVSKVQKKLPVVDFSGTISSIKSLVITNKNLPDGRYGRR
jgi:transcriptional regulator with XRE-family HTH domain